ncbi:MAG: VOC family protein [Rhodospirillales bacterium]|nr:VOC family protein [Rhodospirillales bacterium]MDH3910400.1 VOC family protein [Rhodospirillales bacterium]MDH3966352.1 VOC family protein [Rhodospirillales bacterium]
MHKSRLGVVVIDCETDDFDREAEFWSRALGGAANRSPDPENENYIELETAPDDMNLLLQKVEHPSRVHLDIETDDIEAEAARLEKLGAKRVAKIKRWWVMEAPSGHRFCLVNPQRADFEEGANEWE